MNIQSLLVSLMLCVMPLAVAAQDAPEDSANSSSFHFDCSNKEDGNYPDPKKCDHYIACVAHKHAYEMPCQQGHNGQRLHYVWNSGPNPATSRCDYPEVAGCFLSHDQDEDYGK
jgi:hypothetical protein